VGLIATELDHIVIAAKSLDEGRAWAGETLGVAPVGGGRHEGLATHNALLRLDGKRYLEIIAIDPDATQPAFPRWFGLDTPEVHELIAHRPRLVAWVARCTGAADAIDKLALTPGYTASTIRPASRGDLRWRFSFTPDGQRIENGTLPHLIQWGSTVHPCERLPESGLSFTALMLGMQEPEAGSEILSALCFCDDSVQLGQSTPSHLAAVLNSPRGVIVLD
jgi:hypothetical protein